MILVNIFFIINKKMSDNRMEITFSIPMRIMRTMNQSSASRRYFHELIGEILKEVSAVDDHPHYPSIRSTVLHSRSLTKNRECVICLEEMAFYSRVKIPPCGHGYHENCLNHVLAHRFDCCPMCREPFAPAHERRRG